MQATYVLGAYLATAEEHGRSNVTKVCGNVYNSLQTRVSQAAVEPPRYTKVRANVISTLFRQIRCIGLQRHGRFPMGRGRRTRGCNRTSRACAHRPPCAAYEWGRSLREGVDVRRQATGNAPARTGPTCAKSAMVLQVPCLAIDVFNVVGGLVLCTWFDDVCVVSEQMLRIYAS